MVWFWIEGPCFFFTHIAIFSTINIKFTEVVICLLVIVILLQVVIINFMYRGLQNAQATPSEMSPTLENKSAFPVVKHVRAKSP